MVATVHMHNFSRFIDDHMVQLILRVFFTINISRFFDYMCNLFWGFCSHNRSRWWSPQSIYMCRIKINQVSCTKRKVFNSSIAHFFLRKYNSRSIAHVIGTLYYRNIGLSSNSRFQSLIHLKNNAILVTKRKVIKYKIITIGTFCNNIRSIALIPIV